MIDETQLFIQGIKIGDLLISTLPGELYVQIGINIKERSPFAKNIVVENSHNYLGYVPMKELFVEKSDLYEMTLSYHSNLVPKASDIITKKALEIANKLYK